MKNIKCSSKERLKFNEKIEYIFLNEILDNAFITDESTLHDFVGLFDVSRSHKKLENGKYLFEIQFVKDLNSKEVEIKMVEEKGTNDKADIINKIRDIFEVDVSEKFGLKFPELFLFLQKEMKKIKKIELGLV